MFKDLKSLLPKVVQRSGIAKKIGNTKILEMFDKIKNKILPSELSKKIKSLYIKNEILVVASISKDAVKELRTKEEKIINEINEKAGEKTVQEIKYVA